MINQKSSTIAMFLLSILITTVTKAQSIYFNFTNGTNTSYNLDNVRKITFDNDLMNLHLWDGSIYAWNVSTIGYYQYEQTNLNIQECLNDANSMDVSVFPNPTSSSFNVRFNLLKEDIISISLFDMLGNVISEKKIGKLVSGQYQETFDLTNLYQGIFICRIQGQYQSVTKTILQNEK
jgi:hypothetical protein